jgi:carboxyl-terminal processing protease
MAFKLTDSDFKNFKNYLKSNNFDFKTKTEDQLNELLEVAKNEEIDKTIENDYSKLISTLKSYKNQAVDENKSQLTSLLENEIIKRYFYREGLHKYYLAHNNEIKKAVEVLSDANTYRGFLN